MHIGAQDAHVRQCFAQNARQNRTDGILRLKMACVDEVQTAVFCFLKVIVFEIRRRPALQCA